jgi:hypothetical protein
MDVCCCYCLVEPEQLISLLQYLRSSSGIEEDYIGLFLLPWYAALFRCRKKERAKGRVEV